MVAPGVRASAPGNDGRFPVTECERGENAYPIGAENFSIFRVSGYPRCNSELRTDAPGTVKPSPLNVLEQGGAETPEGEVTPVDDKTLSTLTVDACTTIVGQSAHRT